MKIITFMVLLGLFQIGWAMPATDSRDCTFVARNNDFQQVVIAVTGNLKDVPFEGITDAPIVVIASLVDEKYKPSSIKWMLPRPYYGGGLAYKNGTMYLLAINNGMIVWELSREISINTGNNININVPLTDEEFKVILAKRVK